jgi:hypothetical protein
LFTIVAQALKIIDCFSQAFHVLAIDDVKGAVIVAVEHPVFHAKNYILCIIKEPNKGDFMKTGFSEDNNEKFSEIYKELDPMLYNTTSKNTDFILAHGVEIDTLRGIRNVLEHGKVNGSYPRRRLRRVSSNAVQHRRPSQDTLL